MQEAHRLYRLYIASLQHWGDQADPQEQSHLGECYFHGSGVGKDEKEAARLFQLSAAQGNADGQFNLGLYYKGVDKDHNKAFRMFQLSAIKVTVQRSTASGFVMKMVKE